MDVLHGQRSRGRKTRGLAAIGVVATVGFLSSSQGLRASDDARSIETFQVNVVVECWYPQIEVPPIDPNGDPTPLPPPGPQRQMDPSGEWAARLSCAVDGSPRESGADRLVSSIVGPGRGLSSPMGDEAKSSCRVRVHSLSSGPRAERTGSFEVSAAALDAAWDDEGSEAEVVGERWLEVLPSLRETSGLRCQETGGG